MTKERSATGKSAEQEVFRLQKKMDEQEREVDRIRKQTDARVKDLQRQLELSEDDRTRLKKELSSVVMQAMEADKVGCRPCSGGGVDRAASVVVTLHDGHT